MVGPQGGFAVGGFSPGLVITKATVNYYPGIKTDAEIETLVLGGGVTWVVFESRGLITANLGDAIWVQIAENTNFKAMHQPD